GSVPMHLLRPKRLIQDEGVLGALNIFKNVIRNPQVRRRIIGMRQNFEKYKDNMAAITMVAKKIKSGSEKKTIIELFATRISTLASCCYLFSGRVFGVGTSFVRTHRP
ncbi:MAG: hypothetical protein AAF530_02520, partial [Pseudomonadota bacterium]